MAYLNKVYLVGNLGKDLDVRTFASGKKASFSLATSRRYRDKNGEQKEETDWHNVEAWGKMVDTLQQLNVGKGSSLLVEGSLHNNSWTDQASGQKRISTVVRLDSFQLLNSRNGGNGQQQGGNSYSQQTNEMYAQQQNNNPYSHSNQQQGAPTAQEAAPDEDDDGLPF